MTTIELDVGPLTIENLIKSVRRDGFKRYHEQAKRQLIAQVREARYSIAAFAMGKWIKRKFATQMGFCRRRRSHVRNCWPSPKQGQYCCQ